MTIGISVLLVGGIIAYLSLVKDATHEHTLPAEMQTAEVTTTDHAADHSEHGMSVVSEQEFIAKMIPHHEEAVAAATALLEDGTDNMTLTVLAEEIIEAQTKEIALLRSWYEEWYGAYDGSSVLYAPMMREMSTSSQSERARVFLEDMIVHHEGALAMADSVAAYPIRDEVRTLAKGIIASQSEEIVLMKDLLATLPEY